MNPETDHVWTSAAAREAVLGAYATRVRGLGPKVESRQIATGFGSTHVLLDGDPSAPAVVVIHGGNGDASQMAAAYAGLGARHRCVFVDVPGGPNPSVGPPIPKHDGSLARWLGEVLDALGIEDAALLGMSAGAYVALRAALGLGPRIRCVAALVPEGFVELGEVPEARPGQARAFLDAITSPDSGFPPQVIEHMVPGMELTFAAMRAPVLLGPLFRAEEFVGFEVPTLVVAGGRDRIFDGRALIEGARAIVPSLVDAILIPEANHLHLRLFRGPEIDRVAAFLSGA